MRIASAIWRGVAGGEGRGEGAGDDAAARLDRVAAGAIEREQPLTLRGRARRGVDRRDRGTAEGGHIGDQRPDLALREGGAGAQPAAGAARRGACARSRGRSRQRARRHHAGSVRVQGCPEPRGRGTTRRTRGRALDRRRRARGSSPPARLAGARRAPVASKCGSARTPQANATTASARRARRPSGPPTCSADSNERDHGAAAPRCGALGLGRVALASPLPALLSEQRPVTSTSVRAAPNTPPPNHITTPASC